MKHKAPGKKITGRESRLQAFSVDSRTMRLHRNGLRKSVGLPGVCCPHCGSVSVGRVKQSHYALPLP